KSAWPSSVIFFERRISGIRTGTARTPAAGGRLGRRLVYSYCREDNTANLEHLLWSCKELEPKRRSYKGQVEPAWRIGTSLTAHQISRSTACARSWTFCFSQAW
ncbi:hypothetical protein HPB47_023935, partial [Ixodes persulcatus]